MKAKAWAPDRDRHPSDWFITSLQAYDALDIPSLCDENILKAAWDDDRKAPPNEPPRPFTDELIQIQAAHRLGAITGEQAHQLTGQLRANMAEALPLSWALPEWQKKIVDHYSWEIRAIDTASQRKEISESEADRQGALLLDAAVLELAEGEELEKRRARETRALKRDRLLTAFKSRIPTGDNDPALFDKVRLKCPLLHDSALEEFTEPDKTVHYWHGESGTGKSWTAVMAGMSEFDNGDCSDVCFIQASELKDNLATLKDSKNDHSKTAFIASLAYCDLLIIDDLFLSVSGPFLESLRRILAERGNAPTIITSNYSLSEARNLGVTSKCEKPMEAVIRRIEDRANVIEFSKAREAALQACIEGDES